jgi:hypothetical protein
MERAVSITDFQPVSRTPAGLSGRFSRECGLRETGRDSLAAGGRFRRSMRWRRPDQI